MARHPRKLHSSNEFGQSGSSSISGLDAPMIGAGPAIIVDGIVERESGKTPPPPPISSRTLAIVLGVCLFLAVALVVVFLMTTQIDWSTFWWAFTPQP